MISTNEIESKHLYQNINNALKDAFKGFVKSDDANPVLSFIFTDHIDSFIIEQDCFKIKDVYLSDKQIRFKDTELDFLINANEKYTVYLNVSDKETLKSSLRFFNKSFKNKHNKIRLK